MTGGSFRIWDRRKTRQFQEQLLAWYESHRRVLPWRSHPTPYRVWISEIMLQQTQVQTVLPYFEKFVRRFPGVQSLAKATEEAVVRAWSGLGYYRRARNLHRAARRIVVEHGGRFPDAREDILALPGIGRYTAGAIQSIAFNQPQPIVDGNVRRVISRLHALHDGAGESFFWKQAAAWIPADRAGDFNQAVMELGAIVCVAGQPRCGECPVRTLCGAHRKGIANDIPRSVKARAPESLHFVMLVVQRNGRTLLVPNSIPFVPGEWGLPITKVLRSESPARAARRLMAGSSLSDAPPGDPTTIRHGITHRRIRADVFFCQVRGARSGPGGKWVAAGEVDRYITSSLFLKALGRR